MSAGKSSMVSVVVPCYNEVENVPILLDQLEEVFAAMDGVTPEYLFVDDASTDGTLAAMHALSHSHPHLRPVALARQSGQSAALVAGLCQARGDYIVTLDGDLQNDPADIPRFLELLDEYDCVCGYRLSRQDTWVRRVSSRIANGVRGWLLKDGIRDSGCGMKGFHRSFVAYVVPFNGVHRFLAVFMREAGLSVVECPVSHHPRRHGRSKYGVHNRLWRGLYDLIGVAWIRRRFVHPELRSPDGQVPVHPEVTLVTSTRPSSANALPWKPFS